MIKLKVCGMRDQTNISDLLKLKPDYIGLIFHKPSPRFVHQIIPIEKPKATKIVGVFVDEELASIKSKIEAYNLDVVQLHGKETPEFCRAITNLGVEVIKAFNIDDQSNFSYIDQYTDTCNFFLFDTKGKLPGGNGHSFNWNILSKYKGKTPFFLSGGISLSMAWKIKYLFHPQLYAIDINSKFEYAKALKNVNNIQMFKDEIQGR